MINLRKALVAIAAVASFGAAQAVTIIDTGPGGAAPNNTGEVALAINAYRGVTFSLASAMTVTGVEAWIAANSAAGNVVMALHAGATPTGDELFSTTVNVTGAASAWHGNTALNWGVLQAGSYTLTVTAPDGFSGIMQTGPAAPLVAPNTEWRFNLLNGGWREDTANDFGWRINAIPAVPEPETYALLMLGLGVVGASVRRQRKA